MDKLRQALKDLLSECKPEQIEFFNRLYGSVETIDAHKIIRATRQIEQTLLKNKIK